MKLKKLPLVIALTFSALGSTVYADSHVKPEKDGERKAFATKAKKGERPAPHFKCKHPESGLKCFHPDHAKGHPPKHPFDGKRPAHPFKGEHNGMFKKFIETDIPTDLDCDYQVKQLKVTLPQIAKGADQELILKELAYKHEKDGVSETNKKYNIVMTKWQYNNRDSIPKGFFKRRAYIKNELAQHEKSCKDVQNFMSSLSKIQFVVKEKMSEHPKKK